MERAKLIGLGQTVTRVGFGSSAIGGHEYGTVDDRESERAIRAALDHGIDFFDTADIYGLGRSESVLGKALGQDARRVVVATKFGVTCDSTGQTRKDCSPARLAEAVEGSLRRLGVDRISLYQLHWHDGSTPIEDVMGALVRLREQGKIAAFGCSNLPPDMLRRALAAAPISSFQFSYGLADREAEGTGIPEILDASSVAGIAYNVLARGLLTGKYSADSKFSGTDTRARDAHFRGERFARLLRLADVLRDIAAECGCTPGQVAIAWTLGRPGVAVALTGIRNEMQAAENASAASWILPQDCRAALDKASESARVSQDQKK
jgi:aryl-alcohol dehydrogenase-like predicted oxidoreductase